MISGVALPASLDDDDAMFKTSCKATTEPSAVPLVIAIALLVKGATVSFRACGKMTYMSALQELSPVERAASHWPLGIESMPAQKISSENAANTNDRANHVDVNALIEI